MSSQWSDALRERFSEREDLGRAMAYQQYWSDLPEHEVMALFDFIQNEYGLPPGVLHPEDLVEKLIDPLKTMNPFKWLLFQARTEDRHSELNYQLRKCLERHNTVKAWEGKEILRMEDLFRAWCGKLPSNQQ